VETAEIAFGATGLDIVQDRRLRECDFGELNGMPVSELEAIRSRHIDEPFPGGESYRQVVSRVGELLDELVHERPSQRIILIGHSATRWALDHLLDETPLESLVDAPFEWQEGWEYRLEEHS